MSEYGLRQAAIGLTAPQYSPNGLSRRALRLVHEYIAENLGERVTVDDLAQVTGLSRFHFCRLFRRSTGESPMRYLQRCRLQYAKRLLAHGNLTIAEIAVIAGFCDQSHFSRSFRKFAGMTPREFAHESGDCECSMSTSFAGTTPTQIHPLRCSACS